MPGRRPKKPSQPPPQPPAELPADPARFWASEGGAELWKPPASRESAPTLKRLGPIPLPKSTFPLMGFLATLYEHVATHTRQALEGRKG